MSYLEIEMQLENSDFAEIFIAELGQLSFESFEETHNGLKAYILKKYFDPKAVQSILERYNSQTSVQMNVKELENKNWNEVWESNFEPIMVEDKVLVKAPFHHISQSYPYTLTIEPKMSFGTGHHATTFLMLQRMLELDFKDKSVLDYGCGTGILAIMAKKLGAGPTLAIDIEEWAYKNALENIVLNQTPDIEVTQGDHQTFNRQKFDIILANINRNVLLDTMETMKMALKKDGILLMSGLLVEDEAIIVETARNHSLKLESKHRKENWLVLHFLMMKGVCELHPKE